MYESEFDLLSKQRKMKENVSSRNVSSHLFSNRDRFSLWRIREKLKIRERGEE
jgi:hypothetical protein